MERPTGADSGRLTRWAESWAVVRRTATSFRSSIMAASSRRRSTIYRSCRRRRATCEQGGVDGHESDLANGDFDKDDDSSASDSEYAEYAESDSSESSSLESTRSGMGVFVLRVPDQPERGGEVHAHEQVVLQRAERQLEFVHRGALGEGQQEGGGAA